MKFLDRLQPYIINIWLLSVLIAFATLNYVGYAIRPGLDPSYKFAFNYFFEHNIQIGKDVLFTLGPLGFIYAAMPIGNNILIASITTLILKFIFLLSSFHLYRTVREPMSPYSWLIIIPISYIVASGIGIHHVILFIPLIFILLYIEKNNILYLYAASAITALGLLIKSSTGITILLILISFSIYSVWRKKYIVPIVLLLSTTIIFLLSWFLLYYNLEGIIEYFYATLEFSKGNSSVMTLNPDNNWYVFVTFAFFFITYPLFQKDILIKTLYFITILTTAAIFKFAISREDHIFEFENYLFDFAFIVFIASKNFNLKTLIHLALIYTSFLSFIYFTPWKNHIKGRLQLTHIPHKPFKNIASLNTELLVPHLQKISQHNLQKRVLDTKITKIIGKNSIDTYPTFTTYFYVNKLHWTPRPIFQSYITYTPYLDNKNAQFYNSRNAPKFILWSLEDKMNSLGGQYLLNNAPKTLFSIYNHYSIIKKQKDYALFQRIKGNNLKIYPLKKNKYSWNEWIPVPQLSTDENNAYFLAKTSIERSITQKLKKLIYKEFEVYIEYKLHDNSIKRHRIAIDTAKGGLWANPLPNELFQYPIGQEVKAIRFTHQKYDYFKDEIFITWEKVISRYPLFRIKSSKRKDIFLSNYLENIKFHIEEFSQSNTIIKIKGWAFVENSSIDLSKKYIIFKNDINTFIYTTDMIERGDITRHFKAKNLHHAGFELHMGKHTLPKASYELYLLLIDQNQQQYITSLNKSIKVQ